jgi:hypothetical protein
MVADAIAGVAVPLIIGGWYALARLIERKK